MEVNNRITLVLMASILSVYRVYLIEIVKSSCAQWLLFLFDLF